MTVIEMKKEYDSMLKDKSIFWENRKSNLSESQI